MRSPHYAHYSSCSPALFALFVSGLVWRRNSNVNADSWRYTRSLDNLIYCHCSTKNLKPNTQSLSRKRISRGRVIAQIWCSAALAKLNAIWEQKHYNCWVKFFSQEVKLNENNCFWEEMPILFIFSVLSKKFLPLCFWLLSPNCSIEHLLWRSLYSCII